MEQTAQELTGKELFLAEFARFGGQPALHDHTWLQALRKEAIGRFDALGFPTTKQEEWRFTNITPLTEIPFRSVVTTAECGGCIGVEEQGADLIRPFTFEGTESARLVFVNGRYASKLSNLSGLPEGVKVSNLATALERDGETVRKHLAQYAHWTDHPFVALNTALIEEGAFVQIPRGVVIEEPIHLLYLTAGETEPLAMHVRNLIVAGESSQARIIESYASANGGTYFTNAVTEIFVGENASIEHYKYQQESRAAFHMASIQAHQRRDSHFTSFSIAVGGALARNDIGAVLDDEGCDCVLNGLYLGMGKQLVDHHTRLVHAKSHCTSHQVYKGILDDSASGVFNGRILVKPDAQKTDAIQSSRALLLTETATINTQPQLEIFADDVRCTHGATVGQLDAEAVFYLRSRGIDETAARGLLTYAFANEVIDKIKVEALRVQIEQILYKRFGLKRPAEDPS